MPDVTCRQKWILILVVICLSAYLGFLADVHSGVVFWLDTELKILKPLTSGHALYVIDIFVFDRDLGMLASLIPFSDMITEPIVTFPESPMWVDISYSQCAGTAPWQPDIITPSNYPSNQYGWNYNVLEKMMLDAETDAIIRYYESFDLRIYDARVSGQCVEEWVCFCQACQCYGRTYYLLTSESDSDRVRELGQEIYP